MSDLIETLSQRWPWYISGPLIGLTVPALLLLGNKSFGISSTLRHLCAMCIPAKIPFFQYNWRKESWNLVFVFGIFLGGFFSAQFLGNKDEVVIDENLRAELLSYGISDFSALVPADLFDFHMLLSLKGFVLIVVGGVLVGFGTRYAGGCTSGHSITGISMLQPASLIATICFMAGGFICSNLILPFVLSW